MNKQKIKLKQATTKIKPKLANEKTVSIQTSYTYTVERVK